MSAPELAEITRTLRDLGAAGSVDALFDRCQDELRTIAHRQRTRHVPSDTFSTTALVNEAYLKLRQARGGPADRRHFFALAALAMRDILVDEARRRASRKGGGGQQRESLSAVDAAAVADGDDGGDVLAVDAALTRLERVDTRLAEVVRLRYFLGCTDAEIAAHCAVTERTVQRDWAKARAWLLLHLAPDRGR
jgi:RNA polymerase sigma factor (TIGR02999 family)